MAKEKGTMSLSVVKILMKEIGDWTSPELDVFAPGLYLCENSDGGMFLTLKDPFGGRFGFYLPITEIGLICAKEGEQKVFEQIKPILEKGFEGIDGKLKKIESLAYDNNLHLNDVEVKSEENLTILRRVLESMDFNLANIYEKFNDLQRSRENQNSSLTEMGEVVVNIIKATK